MQDNELTLLEARDKFAGLIDYLREAAVKKEAIDKVEYHLFRKLLSLGWSLLVYFLNQKGLGDVGRSCCEAKKCKCGLICRFSER